VKAISYGTAITTIKVPDKNGKIEDVALGFDDVEGQSRFIHILHLSRSLCNRFVKVKSHNF
jgi:hypothetical protein